MRTNTDGHTCVWDFDSQLKSVDTDGDNVPDLVFQYDALFRRVSKTGTDSTVYSHLGQKVVAEYINGAVPAQPAETYVYGAYIDDVLVKDGTGVTGDPQG